MNKKVNVLFRDELCGKIMKEFVGLRAKTYSYLIDDDSEHKKVKGTKKCVIKKDLCLKTIQIACLMIKPYQNHKKDLKVTIIMYTLNKSRLHEVVMMIRDYKHFDKIITYPYRANAFKVCKSEMLSKYK